MPRKPKKHHKNAVSKVNLAHHSVAKARATANLARELIEGGPKPKHGITQPKGYSIIKEIHLVEYESPSRITKKMPLGMRLQINEVIRQQQTYFESPEVVMSDKRDMAELSSDNSGDLEDRSGKQKMVSAFKPRPPRQKSEGSLRKLRESAPKGLQQ